MDDCINKVLWTKLFLKDQEIDISSNVIQQDNESAMKLKENGCWSAGKCSKVINIRYFFISDQIEKGNVVIEYEGTKNMLTNFLTKPLQGHVFHNFRSRLMGCTFQDSILKGK